MKKRRMIWFAGSAAALAASFLLCRYAFFSLHGMRSYPLALAAAGLAVIGVAAVFDGRAVMLCTVAGYLSGFVLGMLLGVDGTDPGGGATNNSWMIWTLCYTAAVLCGAALQIAAKHRGR